MHSPLPLAYSGLLSHHLYEQQDVYRRICPAGGHTPKAVRLHKPLGLLPKPRRRGKYRVYWAEDLKWVCFIREARRLGCKLGELVPLLIKKPRIAGLFVIQDGRLS
ncbi:MerR family transcriptional regulator [Aeromonas hydrophila]|uniref:MerR family transcriptional regulator n=1 Tax=Aeromonas hydrophila TaxID=644 RepID=UPI00345CFBD2